MRSLAGKLQRMIAWQKNKLKGSVGKINLITDLWKLGKNEYMVIIGLYSLIPIAVGTYKKRFMT